jgi:hypothetical protein
MLQSLLYFPATGKDIQTIIDYYQTHSVIEGSRPFGMLRGELICPTDNADSLTVVALWPSREAYEMWLSSKERATALSGLGENLMKGVRAWTVESDPAEAISVNTSLEKCAGYGARPVTSLITVVAN